MSMEEKWLNTLLSRPGVSVPQQLSVNGEQDAHLGPRLEVAQATFVIEPASKLQIVVPSDVRATVTDPAYADAAIFGLLDVLICQDCNPVSNVKITLTHLNEDPVSSSESAFRHAGRDAARKLLSMRSTQSTGQSH